MNKISEKKISKRSLITTFDKEFSLDDKTCLMFMETTGLKVSSSKIALVSITYNSDGNGHILQVFNHGDEEENTLKESLDHIRKFDNILISYKWFKTYYTGKLNQYNHDAKLSYIDINVAIKHFYKDYSPGFDINDAEVASIHVYKEVTKNQNSKMIEDYLEYNRNHSLAYQMWKSKVIID